MQKALVSVIIPVYNMENYIDATLKSVLASSYSNLEIVVVDDGSVDKSGEIVAKIASEYPNVHFFKQENKGVAAARNYAISLAKGEYILPVDADNLISKEFISKAVEVLLDKLGVKVVVPKAEFFGDRTGEWKLPTFSLKLLARKNMIDTCAMYRKADWERIGGYCEEIFAREDWEFWISMLKNGGDVAYIDEIGLFYRVRKDSKRVKDRILKKHLIDVLNQRHKSFFKKQLGGKLHYNRSWSRVINFFISLIKSESITVNNNFNDIEEFIHSLPENFSKTGNLLHKGRNEVKEFEINEKVVVVKSFGIPNIFNRIIYGNFRKSKAKRSYLYAGKLLLQGISTPEPVAFIESKILFFFNKSYYVSLKSECKYDFRDIEKQPDYPDCNNILKEIAKFTAKLHENGILHTDYSAGNILFGYKSNNEILIQVIDLNRLKFKKRINCTEGCRNFERLNLNSGTLEIIACEYAKAREYQANECIQLIKKFRWKKHQNSHN